MRRYALTEAQVRRIVFETSVAYASALRTGSVQEAEWARGQRLESLLRALPQPTHHTEGT